MKLLKTNCEIRVFREIEKSFGKKLMFVYKYITEIVLLNQTERAVQFKFITTVDRFIFLNCTNVFEGKPRVSSRTLFIPTSAILSESNELLEIKDWLVKKEKLTSFAVCSERGALEYQIVTEELLLSKYPSLRSIKT
ncbi:hypothetical protein GC101_25905 [Paenibacillus sp. LMG 31459]|uniref:Uncharacterized protein n=1 Tax=Paenibacillus phytohabitans TaxID=2654978 RepID=A0ABX1YQZ0_9BACL|nr:hypothetical protein [Paenibacillus phytohabitans]NOU82306.1 hypothetical protein [Paenibacillus phytohabitans]